MKNGLMMSNGKITSSFYKTLTKTHKYIVDRAKSDKNKAIEIFNLPVLGSKKTSTKNPLNDYLDNLYAIIEESCYIKVISDFEKIVFDKFKNASGEIKKNVEGILEDEFPFSKCEKKFVISESEVDKISKVLPIIENKIGKEDFSNLTDFINYRNYLAHGKRFVPSEVVLSFQTKYSFDDVVDTLNKILDNI
ncbi:MAG: hypothetical protein GY754_16215 [bacterium]|nr:hypothetical protein [bacterium]